MKSVSFLIGLFLATASLAQQVPNTFSAGTPAVADEVNANFADADGRINTNTATVNQILVDGQALVDVVSQLFAVITTESSPIVSDTFVATATCPVNTIPLSASCGCTGDGIVANFGFIEACFVIPDGAIGVCNIDFTFDPNLPDPTLDTFALCLGATLVDGTPAFATTSPAGAPTAQQAMKRTESQRIVQEVTDRAYAHHARALQIIN